MDDVGRPALLEYSATAERAGAWLAVVRSSAPAITGDCSARCEDLLEHATATAAGGEEMQPRKATCSSLTPSPLSIEREGAPWSLAQALATDHSVSQSRGPPAESVAAEGTDECVVARAWHLPCAH